MTDSRKTHTALAHLAAREKGAAASHLSISRRSIPICAKASHKLDADQPRELDEIDTVFVSRKALAAGSSIGVPDRIVAMIGELSQ